MILFWQSPNQCFIFPIYRIGRDRSEGRLDLLRLFMDHAPVDWHDSGLDVAVRQAMIRRGFFFFPVATKQYSISLAHTEEEIEITISAFGQALDEAIPVS